jgi:hypothetical protein
METNQLTLAKKMSFAQINNCVFMDKDEDWFVIILWNRKHNRLDAAEYDLEDDHLRYYGAIKLETWIEKEDKNLGKIPIYGLENFPNKL